ncbi:MAG TPA: Thivi_2564 family membrane protein [Candidatus Sulfopaludibacter sp.]|nr:Thivi_2564 family membrane protein [Candidatus Sulfopaludibacter sp.]
MPLLHFIVPLALVAIAAWLVNAYIPMSANTRSLVNIVLTLIVVGMGLWAINTYVPMAGSIQAILNIVVVAAACVRVLQAVGLWDRTLQLWSNLTHRHASH